MNTHNPYKYPVGTFCLDLQQFISDDVVCGYICYGIVKNFGINSYYKEEFIKIPS